MHQLRKPNACVNLKGAVAVTAEKKRWAKKPPVVRAYQLQNVGNAGKLQRVAAVLSEFRKGCRVVQHAQMRRFVEHGEPFWNRRKLPEFESKLSARYQRSVQNQVVVGLDSWLELTKIVIRQMIRDSSLPEGVKGDLWWLNKCGAHYQTPEQATVPVWEYGEDGHRILTKERRPAPAETLALLRQMTKHVRKHRVSAPQLWRSRTMALDGTVAQVEASKQSGQDFWVRVSTLEPGNPVWLPLRANRFFNDAAGELSNFAQMTVGRGGEVKVALVKRSTKATTRSEGPDIALDWGLKTMFATDLGDQLGRRLYPWVRNIDPKLMALTAELQRQGVSLKKNKRYRRFNQRIRDHVRNEVGRVVNHLIEVHGPRSLTVEQLDFRDGGISRQMNRLLTKAGRRAVAEKLAAVAETLGITIREVNPAYSSQECSGCGFVSSANRKNSRFQCGFCHKVLNADTNGARVISARRSGSGFDLQHGRRAVLRQLDAAFEARWGLSPGTAKKLRQLKERPNQKRPNTDGLAAVPRTRQIVSIDLLSAMNEVLWKLRLFRDAFGATSNQLRKIQTIGQNRRIISFNG